MCIPKCAKEKEAAELFINFMCDPEISGANMDYICYGSPISAAKEYMEDYLAESEIVYPDAEILGKGSSYAFLSEEISRYVEGLYQASTKINAGQTDEETPGSPVALVAAVAVLAAAGGAWFLLGRKKKKA